MYGIIHKKKMSKYADFKLTGGRQSQKWNPGLHNVQGSGMSPQ